MNRTPENRIPEQLNGWKEIACHMNRSVRCVQRWERNEKLPVRRHGHRHGASVYASREELDAWWEGERPSSKRVISGRTGLPVKDEGVVTGETVSGERGLSAAALALGPREPQIGEFALNAHEVTAIRFLLMLLQAGVPKELHSSAAERQAGAISRTSLHCGS